MNSLEPRLHTSAAAAYSPPVRRATRIRTATNEKRLVIGRGAERLVDVGIAELKGRYKSGFEGV